MSYAQFKNDLANRWKSRRGAYLPHCWEEYFDTADQPGDDEKIKTDFVNRSKKKVIVSGDIIEVYEYEYPVRFGEKQEEKKPKKIDPETGEVLRYDRTNGIWTSAIDPETGYAPGYDPVEQKRHHARESRLLFRRIIAANFTSGKAKFYTLTFRDGAVSDVTDIRECNREFDKFMKRMKRKYGNFKYAKVIEFQDGAHLPPDRKHEARGAVHYHIMLEVPYIGHQKIAEMWGNGTIGVNRIDKVDNLGAYMTKYISKNFDDPRLFGEKAYSTSKGLMRPVELYGEEADEIIDDYIFHRRPVFESQYESEWQGKIRYSEYNLQRE